MKISGYVMPFLKTENEEGIPTCVVCCLLCVCDCCACNCVLNVYGEKTAGEKSAIIKPKQYQSVTAVKWLAAVQVICGMAIIAAQSLCLHWTLRFRGNSPVTIDWSYRVVDYYVGAGFWCGAFVLVTGIIGCVSAKLNKFGMIIAHLVLNVLALPFAIVAIVCACMTTTQLVECKLYGSSAQHGWGNYDYININSSTSPAPALYPVFGELLTSRGNSGGLSKFYCTQSMFTNWLALEVVMMVGGLITIAATIWFLVLNSRALCPCCDTCCIENDPSERSRDEIPILVSDENKEEA